MLDVRERLAADDLPVRLTLLGFRDDDRAAAVSAVAAVLARPAEVAAVQTMAERLALAVGVIGDPWDGSLPWPWRAEGTDSPYGSGVLELLALLVSVDEVRAYHASRGIGDDDSWRALSDLGQQVFVHRLTYGSFGLHTQDWLRVAWSGALYWLGRLQFNLQPDPLAPGDPATKGEPAHGTWVLSTHIPRSGPLTPVEVDASFAAARIFFAEYFGEFSVGAFHCHSWLLDPELAAALPVTSNMALFQRRWTLAGEEGDGDEDAVFFTFAERPPVDLSSLPRDTTLQRAILDRLVNGGHWHVCHGLIPYTSD
ncbi:MAG TPA: acyltransferase domain-containing protein [Microlunatus sp.]